MRLLDDIRNFFRRSKAVEEEPVASAPRTGSVNIFAPAGMDLSIATVYRCVNILADSVANLPVQYMRLKGDIFAEDKSSRLHYLLNVQPCPYMSAVDFWRLVVQHLLLNGDRKSVV